MVNLPLNHDRGMQWQSNLLQKKEWGFRVLGGSDYLTFQQFKRVIETIGMAHYIAPIAHQKTIWMALKGFTIPIEEILIREQGFYSI